MYMHHMCAQCPWMPEDSLYLELKARNQTWVPLQEQPVILSSEVSLQPSIRQHSEIAKDTQAFPRVHKVCLSYFSLAVRNHHYQKQFGEVYFRPYSITDGTRSRTEAEDMRNAVYWLAQPAFIIYAWTTQRQHHPNGQSPLISITRKTTPISASRTISQRHFHHCGSLFSA